MKKLLAIAALMTFGAAGCTHLHSLAPSTNSGKVFLTKTTSYIIFANNSAYECDIKGDVVSNCQPINFE